MRKSYRLMLLLSMALSISTVYSQREITGTVQEETTGNGLPGVNVSVQGTGIGTITDANGKFMLSVSDGQTLVFSFIGYETQEYEVTRASQNISINMVEDVMSLSDLIVVGSRFNPRSVLASPVPIDNITAEELGKTGQTSVDQMINYKVPSYNASQQTISDATAHFNPADLRGLGPSRTLVLVNGKRKNPSSLVYINDTPGKGEVGVDMQSIPVEAIERIEILRDGASAQYGSDAIAGVINVILKKDVKKTNINVFSGVTSKGDGFNIGVNANTGFQLLSDGYFNVSVGAKKQNETNRAGEPGDDKLFAQPSTQPWIKDNPSLGMRVGQPNMETFSGYYNAGIPLGSGELYSFGGLTRRNGKSYALYRTPYWVPDPHNLLHPKGSTYQGFQPTFETKVNDRSTGLGYKSSLGSWKYDISTVYGQNTVDYTIGNTINVDLGANSPTSFKAGGYKFSNIVNNIDIYKKHNNIGIGFGGEFRSERFVALAGEKNSYEGKGAQSFPGIQPSNEVNKTRFNIGGYADIEYDNDIFLIGGAVRFEKYEDFGNTLNWKLNSRIKVSSNLVLRASASTGFRAPSLHQIYLSNIQTLLSGNTVSNQGTFNNQSPVIKGLKVPELEEEKSFNFSGGLTFNPSEHFEITADYYNISIDNRVLFTGEIGFDKDKTNDNPVEVILKQYQVTSIKFFTNAVDTKTTGAEIVASYKDISTGSGNIDLSFSTNFNTTRIEGSIKTPEPIKASGNVIFNRKEQARITTSRPETKIVFGMDYEIDKFNLGIYLTRFGEVKWQHASDKTKDQIFSAKTITDVQLGYAVTEKMKLSIMVNNLLDVYPDVLDTKGDPVTDLGGRFKYPWEVNQFGFMGMIISGNINIRL